MKRLAAIALGALGLDLGKTEEAVAELQANGVDAG